MRLCIIGAGYVGLTTAACFAELGNEVVCIDKDSEKISKLKAHIIPIFEPGLNDLIERSIARGKLAFSADLKDGLLNSEIIFIAVWTPQKESGEADLTAVKEVASEISVVLGSLNKKTHKIIVIKSTVPPGTSKVVAEIIRSSLKGNVEIDIVSNPEFLREGSAVHDTLYPDRIVIGTENHKAAEAMRELYSPIINQTFPTDIDPRPTFYVPLVLTDIRSAEMIKYASNAFLATKISFINEIAHLCELVHADVTKIIEGMGLDKRIGASFLNAGLGYGGSCFPKDTHALNQIAGNHGHDFKLLKAVIEVNNLQRERFKEKIKNNLGSLKDKTIGVLGLSFKPNTDDMRESPAIEIINWLLKGGAKIKTYDPKAIERAKSIFRTDKIEYCTDSYGAAEGSDALIIVTEWNEFRELDLEKIKSLMKLPVIFDGRNIYEKQKLEQLGFKYVGVGR